MATPQEPDGNSGLGKNIPGMCGKICGLKCVPVPE
jgi:hypothetical protein